MEEIKKIVNFILNNDNFTEEELFKEFMYLFTSKSNDKFYGIQIKDGEYIITHLDESNKVKRYEIKIRKAIQI